MDLVVVNLLVDHFSESTGRFGRSHTNRATGTGPRSTLSAFGWQKKINKLRLRRLSEDEVINQRGGEVAVADKLVDLRVLIRLVNNWLLEFVDNYC